MSGEDFNKPTLAKLEFTKRLTSRRAWFEEHAMRIAHPMGVAVLANKASGHFGRTGHNGVALCGKPAACILAAAAIAKIAEAALQSCSKSDQDTFCANFCRSCRLVDQTYPSRNSLKFPSNGCITTSAPKMLQQIGTCPNGSESPRQQRVKGL